MTRKSPNTVTQMFAHLVQLEEALAQTASTDLKALLETAAQSVCESTGADFVAILPYHTDKQIMYDIENALIWDASRQEKLAPPVGQPREKGLTSLVRSLGELIVHNVDTGDMNDIDLDRIRDMDITRGQIPELIRHQTSPCRACRHGSACY